MDIKLVEAKTDDQLKRVAAIADHIWHEYFPCILTEGQIDYMVDKFCSFKAMKENIAGEGYIYYIIKRGADDIGYTAIKPDGDRLFSPSSTSARRSGERNMPVPQWTATSSSQGITA